MMERMLTNQCVEVADRVIAELKPLPLNDGVSVLLSILAATLNGQAPSDEDARMLATAVHHDLLNAMMKGRKGVLIEGPWS